MSSARRGRLFVRLHTYFMTTTFISISSTGLSRGFKRSSFLPSIYNLTDISCARQVLCHFYINRLGFHAVEFFNEYHPDPNMPEQFDQEDGLFRFEKRMAD